MGTNVSVARAAGELTSAQLSVVKLVKGNNNSASTMSATVG